MLCFNRHILVLVLVPYLIASCGQLPRPFGQKPSKLSDALRQLDDVGGVFIAPVNGLPANISGTLQQAIIQNLNDIDIPASISDAHRYGHTLRGFVRSRNSKSSSVQFLINWELLDEDGKLQGNIRIKEDSLATRQFSQRITSLASEISREVARILRTNLDHQSPFVRPPTVAIGMLDGAPGDGAKVFPVALRAVLRNSGVNVTDNLTKADLTINIHVAVEHVTSLSDQVTIMWAFRNRRGDTVRRLRQTNRVPKDLLKNRWGPHAYDIAVAMRDFIKEITMSFPNLDSKEENHATKRWKPFVAPTQKGKEANSIDIPVESLLRPLEKTQIQVPNIGPANPLSKVFSDTR